MGGVQVAFGEVGGVQVVSGRSGSRSLRCRYDVCSAFEGVWHLREVRFLSTALACHIGWVAPVAFGLRGLAPSVV